MRGTDIIALAACTVISVTGLMLGSGRTVANYDEERDFYDTWGPRADTPFDLDHYTRGTNELGYDLWRVHPPGYSLLVAAGNTITGESFRTAVILSALTAGLFGWVSYLLLVALFDRQRALAGTILLLIAIIPYSFLASADLVGGLAITLPIWALLRKPAPKVSDLLLAGVLAGIAYLIRSQAIFVLIGILVAIPVLTFSEADSTDPAGRKGRRRIILQRTALLVAGFLAATGPWLILNWKLNGSPMYSTSYLQVAVTYWDPFNEKTITAYWRASERFESLSQVVLLDPIGFGKHYLKQVILRMPSSIGIYVLGYPAFFLFGAGLVFLLPDLKPRRFSWLVILFFGYMLLGLVYISKRYFVFLYPVLFFTVGYAAFVPYLQDQFRRLRIRAALGSWALVAFVALVMLREVRIDTRRYLEGEPKFIIELAEVIRERAAPGDRVMVHEASCVDSEGTSRSWCAPTPHIPYLSGIELALVAGDNAEEIIRNGRRQGVRFYVYEKTDATKRPGTIDLADVDLVPPELRPIYVHQPTGTILYELVPEDDD